MKRKAFTLIELLVVIAIIAILAAILFPVFARAKLAAKSAVSISNMKQLALGDIMYAGDHDDVRVLRNEQDQDIDPITGNVTGVNNEYSWKQLIQQYVKSTNIYNDPVNPASKFLDAHSDTAFRTFYGWNPATVTPELTFHRGYAWANSWNPAAGGFDKGGPLTGFREPARTLDIVENKDSFENTGPYLGWVQDVDSEDNYLPIPPTTGLSWNWGGDKWDNKAMAVGWMDGHAKRLAFSDMCGINLNTAPAGTTNYWGLQKGDADWATGMCDSLPQQFR